MFLTKISLKIKKLESFSYFYQPSLLVSFDSREIMLFYFFLLGSPNGLSCLEEEGISHYLMETGKVCKHVARVEFGQCGAGGERNWFVGLCWWEVRAEIAW